MHLQALSVVTTHGIINSKRATENIFIGQTQDLMVDRVISNVMVSRKRWCMEHPWINTIMSQVSTMTFEDNHLNFDLNQFIKASDLVYPLLFLVTLDYNNPN